MAVDSTKARPIEEAIFGGGTAEIDKSGNARFNGRLLTGAVTTSTTATTIDVAACNIVYLNPPSAHDLATLSNGVANQGLFLANTSAFSVTLKTTGNIAITADLTIASNKAVLLIWSALLSKWIVLSGDGLGGGLVDISTMTNLTAGSGIVLTGDALSHSTSPGYKHVPTGGMSGQILQYNANGEAKWVSISGGATLNNGGGLVVTANGHTHTQASVTFPWASLAGLISTGKAQGYVLTYNAGDDTLVFTEPASGGVVATFGSIGDCSFTTLAAGNIPVWSGTAWVNVLVSGDLEIDEDGTASVVDDSHDHTASTITLALNNLSDAKTDFGTLVAGMVFSFDGTEWAPLTLHGGITVASDGTVVVGNNSHTHNQSSLYLPWTSLQNIDLSGMANGRLLAYDSLTGKLKFVESSTGGVISTLEGISDVSGYPAEITDGYIMVRNNGAWSFVPITGHVTFTADGQMFVADDSHDHTADTLTMASTDLSDWDTLDERIGTVEEDLSTAQGAISTAQGNISTLQEDVSGISEDLGTAQGAISNLQTKVNLSGDGTLASDGTLTLANTTVTAGSGNAATFDSKGRCTAVTTITRDLLLTAAGGEPTATGGCTDSARKEIGTNKRCMRVLEFSGSAVQKAYWVIPGLPSDLPSGATFTVNLEWTADTGASGDVVWNIAAVAVAHDGVIDAALGTAAAATATLTAALDKNTTSLGTLTAAGTPATGKTLMIEISRDATNAADTMAAGAWLIGGSLTYTPKVAA